jgi:chromosome segregation ATPase
VTVAERGLRRRVDRLEDQQATWLRLTSDVITRVTARDARLERMESDISTLKSDVGTLKSDVGTLKSDVGTLKSDVETLKTDVVDLKTDMVDVKGQLNRLEVAAARHHNWVVSQFEWLRGHIARREAGER